MRLPNILVLIICYLAQASTSDGSVIPRHEDADMAGYSRALREAGDEVREASSA